MGNKYNTLKKNTIIFTIGNIGSSLISFLLIPLFTNYLTTSEYGRIDFITMLISLLIPIITLNFIESLIRFGVDKEYNYREVISTIIFSLLPIYSFLLLLFLILIKINIIGELSLIYLVIFFIVSIYQFLQQYTRVIEKLIIYASSDILYTAIFSILNIVFIVKFGMGINGYFTSYIVANLIASIFLIIKAKIYKDIKISLYNKVYLKEFIKYSIPLIPNSLSWWIINVSDRFLIKIFSGYSNLGIYSIANKIPQILNTFYGLFFKAWQISSIKELGKEDTEKFYGEIFKYISKVMFTIGICIVLGINIIFYILIGDEFKDAINYVPILVLAIIFFTLASFLGTIYTAYKKSKNILKSTIISALINIAVNIALMPFFGAIVACFSTLVSYVFLFIYRYFDSRQFMRLNIDSKDLITSSIIFLLMTVNISIFKLSLNTFIINLVLFIVYLIINKKYCMLVAKYLLVKINRRRIITRR